MRRWTVWILVGMLLFGVIGAAVFTYLTAPRPRINPDQYHQIREGMTLTEAESIIGGPPGFYPPNSPGTRVRRLAGPEFWNANLQQKYWSGTSYEIGVALDEDEIIVSKQLTEIASPPRWLDDICNLLGL